MVCVVAVWTELPSPSHTYPWSALLLFGQSYHLQAVHTRSLRCCCLDRATVSKPYIPVVCVVAVWTELPSPSHTYPWSALLLFGQSYHLQAEHTRGLRCCCLDRATISKPYISVVCVVAVWTELPSPSRTYPVWTEVCVVAVWTELPSPSHTSKLFGQSYHLQAIHPWSALLLFGQSYHLQAIHTPWSALLLFGQSYHLQAIVHYPVVCVVAVWTELPSPSHTYPWSALILFGQSYRLQAIHTRGLRCCCLDRAVQAITVVCVDTVWTEVCVVAVWTELPSPSRTYPWSALILFGQSYRRQAIHTRGLRDTVWTELPSPSHTYPVVCVVAVWTELPSPKPYIPVVCVGTVWTELPCLR